MKIFTYAFNRPDYLEYQSKCLRHFITEPFDFYCIDNARENKYSVQFAEICNNNNIRYYKNMKPDHSEAGKSHYSALQWSWNNIIVKTEEIIVMMDHDTFPINKVSMTEWLSDASLAGPPQSRGNKQKCIEYFHPSLMIFNTANLPNKDTISFMGSVIDGIATDIGGDLFCYFRDNPNVKRKNLRAGHLHIDDPFFSTELINKYGKDNVINILTLIFENIESNFIHIRNASNWDNWDKKKVEQRDNFVFSILNDKINGVY